MSLFLAYDAAEETYSITSAGYTLMVILMVALLVVGAAVHGRVSKHRMSVKQIAFSAVALALALVTSNIKLLHMPMGGSVTLFSMLFVCLIGYWFGIGGGITAAVAYGILQMFFGAYIISVPQMLCDYILAFGALGLSGVGYRRPRGMVLGYLVGVLGRYIFSVLSGVVFFGMWAPDSMQLFGSTVPLTPLTYSLVYNGAYIGAEVLITLVVILLPPVRRAIDTVGRMAGE